MVGDGEALEGAEARELILHRRRPRRQSATSTAQQTARGRGKNHKHVYRVMKQEGLLLRPKIEGRTG